jgi:serine/threonine protein phosphatase PrpC
MKTGYGVHKLTSPKHPYEDRYRLLGGHIPLVERAGRGYLYAVMDGVGGAPMGMQASQLVADRLIEFYRDDAVEPSQRGVNALLTSINDEAFGWGFIEGTRRPLAAAAVTVAWFAPSEELFTFHVGDTVALLWNGETLRVLTTEHGEGKVIRRYLGMGPAFDTERDRFSIEPGDMLCLITDGVTKALSYTTVGQILAELPDPQRAAWEIAERARRRGSRDDITALVVELEEW